MDVKKGYSDQDWDAKENHYVEESKKLIIVPDPSPKTIMDLSIAIDTLLTEALLDKAFLRSKYEIYEQKVKLLEKQLFIDLKIQVPPQYAAAGLKLTVDEIKGIVVKQIQNDRPQLSNGSLGMNPYEILQKTQQRYYFIESLVDMLKGKKEALITLSAMLKIENDVTKGAPVSQNRN